MPLLTTALVWLTVYRITRLIVADTFPPARAFRDAVARRFGDGSSPAYLVNCPWCSGVWVAALVVGAVVVADRTGWADAPLPVPVLQIAAAAATAGLVSAIDRVLAFMVDGPEGV